MLSPSLQARSSFSQWSFLGAFLIRRGSLRSRAADGLLASRCHGGIPRMPTVTVSARARGGRLSPSPLTDVVREQSCSGPGAAKRPRVGAGRAERSKALSALVPHAARAKASFVDALRVYFPRASGKAAPPPWEQLGGIPVGQVVSLVSGDRARGGALQKCVGKPTAHNLNTTAVSPALTSEFVTTYRPGRHHLGLGAWGREPAPSVSASHRTTRTKTEPRR